MGGMKILTTAIRKDISGGEYLRALIQISTDLEFLFFNKLFFEKRINPELIKGWTLGRYADWVFKNNLIDKEHEVLIRDFIKVRNIIAHSRYAIHNATKDLEKLNFLAKMMLEVCDFIDNTEIPRDMDLAIEKEYSEFLKKMGEKYERAFDKK